MDGAGVVSNKKRTGNRILCLDGGGIKGLNEIEMMKKIEEVSGHKIRDLFDWIGGTSTGGILALGIAVGKDLVELQSLYWELKDKVFKGRDPYDCDKLESLLKKHFGESTKMTDITKPKVVVTGTQGNVFPPRLHLFRSYQPKDHQKIQRIDDIPYWVEVTTGDTLFAGTDANVYIIIHGVFGSTKKLELAKSTSHVNKFERGNTDEFSLMAHDVGEITDITIGHDGSGLGPDWHLSEVMIKSFSRSEKFIFAVDKILSTGGQSEITVKLDRKQDEFVWEAARSTAAAPKYFRHFGPYWDGGLVANNPTLDILSEIQWHVGRSGKPNISCVVSLGCGRVPERPAHVYDFVLTESIKSLKYFFDLFVHQITDITIGHDGSGLGPDWHLSEVMIKSFSRSEKFIFAVDKILSTGGQSEITVKLDRKQDEFVWEAARSTAAAPKYFRHFGPYWDGGLVANNPTLDILSEIQWHVGRSGKPNISCVVSLGCGRVPERPAHVYDFVLTESIKSLKYFFDLFVHQTTGTDECHVNRAMNWCKMIDVPFYRLTPKLADEIDLDCDDDDKLKSMVDYTKEYIKEVEENSKGFSKLAKILTQNLSKIAARDPVKAQDLGKITAKDPVSKSCVVQ